MAGPVSEPGTPTVTNAPRMAMTAVPRIPAAPLTPVVPAPPPAPVNPPQSPPGEARMCGCRAVMSLFLTAPGQRRPEYDTPTLQSAAMENRWTTLAQGRNSS
jgi:hypothetical protein